MSASRHVARPGLAQAHRREQGHDHALSLVQKIRETLYAPPEWALLDHVRSSTGVGHDVLRTADALAVRTWNERDPDRLTILEAVLGAVADLGTAALDTIEAALRQRRAA